VAVIKTLTDSDTAQTNKQANTHTTTTIAAKITTTMSGTPLTTTQPSATAAAAAAEATPKVYRFAVDARDYSETPSARRRKRFTLPSIPDYDEFVACLRDKFSVPNGRNRTELKVLGTKEALDPEEYPWTLFADTETDYNLVMATYMHAKGTRTPLMEPAAPAPVLIAPHLPSPTPQSPSITPEEFAAQFATIDPAQLSETGRAILLDDNTDDNDSDYEEEGQGQTTSSKPKATVAAAPPHPNLRITIPIPPVKNFQARSKTPPTSEIPPSIAVTTEEEKEEEEPSSPPDKRRDWEERNRKLIAKNIQDYDDEVNEDLDTDGIPPPPPTQPLQVVKPKVMAPYKRPHSTSDTPAKATTVAVAPRLPMKMKKVESRQKLAAVQRVLNFDAVADRKLEFGLALEGAVREIKLSVKDSGTRKEISLSYAKSDEVRARNEVVSLQDLSEALSKVVAFVNNVSLH
jgi:hypothetical protein